MIGREPGSALVGRRRPAVTPRPSPLPKRHPRLKIRVPARVVAEFQSDALEIEHGPEPLTARLMLYAVTALVAAAVVWASFARVDEVITARGKLVSTAQNLVVQPLETSIIRSLPVTAGTVVHQGETLAVLDPTFIQADVDQLQGRVASFDGEIARLNAELSRQPFTPLPGTDAALERSLYESRQAQYQAQVTTYTEKIARLQATLENKHADLGQLNRRLQGLQSIEDMRGELEQRQVGSRLNTLQARDARLSVSREISDVTHTIDQTDHELAGAKSERDGFLEEWHRKIAEELVTVRRDRETADDQLNKAIRRHDLVTLKAESDAVVLEVASRSIGSVVKEAEPLMTLVPLNAPLQVEAQIDAGDLGHVKNGDAARIKLEAYPFQRYGTATGVVRTISEDAFSRDQNNQTSGIGRSSVSAGGVYYKTFIDLDRSTLKNLPVGTRLMPGSPITAEIKVGQRTVASYFLYPLLRGMDESIREP
ncbi:MAG TPA: HlyD family type I secretion periplasmic adaptor subunit [Stellaceae bacterium]|nr:HlyD family type I secretion periplasmic adaptor subunit [Stellaceae bacterium]